MNEKKFCDARISYFTPSGGPRLYYESWIPRKARAILVFVHGLSEHTGRYGPLIKSFVNNGYGVALYDQRGHGNSGGQRGHFDNFNDMLSDLAAFISMIDKANPSTPIILVGHSFGGQLALNYVVRYTKRIRGLIVSSPNIRLKMPIPKWKYWLAENLHKVMPRLAVAHSIDAKWLSHDTRVGETYLKDKKIVRKFTLRAGQEILNNLDVVMPLASRIHLPCLFLQAGDDHVCDAEAVKHFYRRIQVSRKRMKVYEGLYHELFNEVDKDIIFSDMQNWLHELLSDEGRKEPKVAPAPVLPQIQQPHEHEEVERGERWTGPTSTRH